MYINAEKMYEVNITTNLKKNCCILSGEEDVEKKGRKNTEQLETIVMSPIMFFFVLGV